MARPELGLKRQCMSCGAKFYDLSRDPAVCPKCGTVYQVAALSSTTRVPAPAIANRAPREEETEEEAGAPEMVSLDEVEAAEGGDDVSVDDDADVSDAGGDDDTFLEEDEESGDDVSDFIDGDIESDEES